LPRTIFLIFNRAGILKNRGDTMQEFKVVTITGMKIELESETLDSDIVEFVKDGHDIVSTVSNLKSGYIIIYINDYSHGYIKIKANNGDGLIKCTDGKVYACPSYLYDAIFQPQAEEWIKNGKEINI
jgi:hypothetical protein